MSNFKCLSKVDFAQSQVFLNHCFFFNRHTFSFGCILSPFCSLVSVWIYNGLILLLSGSVELIMLRAMFDSLIEH